MYRKFVVSDPWNEPADHREEPFERDIVPLFGPDLRDVAELNANIVAIPPGSGTNYHNHVIGELIYIVEGTGEVLLGDEKFPVKSDTVFWAPADVFHHVRNTGATGMKIFTVFAPGMSRSAQVGKVQVRTPPETTRPLE